MANFGVDYDHTYTADPLFFSQIIALGVQRGHQFFIVSGRGVDDFPPEVCEVRPLGTNLGFRTKLRDIVPLILCGNVLKREACEALAIEIDIWVDDMPGMVERCRMVEPSKDSEL